MLLTVYFFFLGVFALAHILRLVSNLLLFVIFHYVKEHYVAEDKHWRHCCLMLVKGIQGTE